MELDHFLFSVSLPQLSKLHSEFVLAMIWSHAVTLACLCILGNALNVTTALSE